MAAGTVWHIDAHYVYQNNSWSEKYFLQPGNGHGSSAIDPIAAAQDILKRRVLWLGSGPALTKALDGTVLTWGVGPVLDLATVSLTDSKTDAYMVPLQGYNALPPNVPFDPINDRCSGPEFRFETPANTSANRILRGCPDAWEADSLPQPPMPVAPAGATDLNGNLTFAAPLPTITYGPVTFSTGTWRYPLAPASLVPAQLKILRASYLDAVAFYCGTVFHGNPPSKDSSTWTMPANNFFNRVVFRQMSDHRTGKRSDISRARSKKRI